MNTVKDSHRRKNSPTPELNKKGSPILLLIVAISVVFGLLLMCACGKRSNNDGKDGGDSLPKNSQTPADWLKNEYTPADKEKNYYRPVDKKQVQEKNGIKYVTGQFVVVSSTDISFESMQELLDSYDLEIIGYIELMDTYQVRLKKETTFSEMEQLAKELSADSRVDAATIDVVWETESNGFPNDPWSKDRSNTARWDSADGTNWGVKAINAPYCWEHYDLGTVKVGIIDTMFDLRHEDLSSQIALCSSNSIFQTYTPIDENDSSKEHGTHVAGIIGATHNNQCGLSGVLEDCNIYAFSLFGYNGSMGQLSAIADMSSRGVRVVNYSMGYKEEYWSKAIKGDRDIIDYYYDYMSTLFEMSLLKLLENAGDYVIVAAAGNSSVEAKWNSVFTYISAPAVKNRIIVVGAAENKNGKFTLTSFSNYGERLDITAPGAQIFSCIPDNQYASWDGTSMAAPHVTGVCASLWAANPNLNGAQIKEIVTERADIPVTGNCPNMINMRAAMESVLQPKPDGVLYTEPSTPAEFANDLATRWLSMMFLEKSNIDGGTFRYDYNKDGVQDWLYQFAALGERPFWMLVPTNETTELQYLRDISVAGEATLLLSGSGDVLVQKKYSSRQGGESIFSIDGEEIVGYEYYMTDLSTVETNYQVEGKDATEEQYRQAVEALGLREFDNPQSKDAVRTPDYSIPNASIEAVAEKLKTYRFVTESNVGDFNGDGYADAIMLADLSEGLPKGAAFVPILAEEKPDDMIVWSAEGIAIISGDNGSATVVFQPASVIRQMDEYRENIGQNATEELVSDAFSGTISDFGVLGATYHIPQINLSSPDIDAINSEIMDNSVYDIQAVRGKANPEMTESYYSWYKNGDILSLLYIRSNRAADWIHYYVYNIKVSERRSATQTEVLVQCGLSEQEYRSEVRTALGSAFWDYYGPNPDTQYVSTDLYNDLLQQTLSVENIDNTQLYLNEKGHPCIEGVFHVNAGKGLFPLLIDLQNYSRCPYFAESVSKSASSESSRLMAKYIVNVGESAYLRTTPEFSEDNIITEIPLGEAVYTYGWGENGFLRVEYNLKYGYVSSDYLGDQP